MSHNAAPHSSSQPVLFRSRVRPLPLTSAPPRSVSSGVSPQGLHTLASVASSDPQPSAAWVRPRSRSPWRGNLTTQQVARLAYDALKYCKLINNRLKTIESIVFPECQAAQPLDEQPTAEQWGDAAASEQGAGTEYSVQEEEMQDSHP